MIRSNLDEYMTTESTVDMFDIFIHVEFVQPRELHGEKEWRDNYHEGNNNTAMN